MSPTTTRRRDAVRSRADILAAAMDEFAEHGHAGARIDRIAAASGMSKPMIYSHFGDKDGLYAAALREAYVQIRAGEGELRLEELSPPDAIRTLLAFTLDHFRRKPWFVSLLNTENLRGGETVREIEDLSEIQSRLTTKLRAVLDRGAAEGVFRDDVDPVDLYLTIASLCYYPVSNRHTMRVVFGRDIADAAWRDRRLEQLGDMLVGWLRPAP